MGAPLGGVDTCSANGPESFATGGGESGSGGFFTSACGVVGWGVLLPVGVLITLS